MSVLEIVLLSIVSVYAAIAVVQAFVAALKVRDRRMLTFFVILLCQLFLVPFIWFYYFNNTEMKAERIKFLVKFDKDVHEPQLLGLGAIAINRRYTREGAPYTGYIFNAKPYTLRGSVIVLLDTFDANVDEAPSITVLVYVKSKETKYIVSRLLNIFEVKGE